MTNYNDGKWHGWNGGECPVHPKTEVYWCAEDLKGFDPAGELGWTHDDLEDIHIIAFKIVEEHKEPREFWMRERGDYWWHCHPDTPGATLFREVHP